MFITPIKNRTGRFYRPIIVNIDIHAHPGIGLSALFLWVITPSIRAISQRLIVRQGIKLETLIAHFLPVNFTFKICKNRIPITFLIVDRDMPLTNSHFIAHWYDNSIGKHKICHPDMHSGITQITQSFNRHARGCFLDFYYRPHNFAQELCHGNFVRRISKLLAVTLARVFIFKKTVKKRRMRRIDPNLHRLQPVCINMALESECVRLRCHKTIK